MEISGNNKDGAKQGRIETEERMSLKKQGYIFLHRRLLDSDVFASRKPEDLKLWIYFLLKASHTKYRFKFMVNGTQNSIIIDPGSFVAGRQKIAEETGVSESKIRRFLEAKKATRKITIKTTKQYSIVSICNYSKYQLEGVKNDQRNNQETGHIQEKIKGNTSNEVFLSVPKTPKIDTPDNANFDTWWKKYSKASPDPHGKRFIAEKKYTSCIKKFNEEQINIATRNYLIECRKARQKTSHASTFLHPENINQYLQENQSYIHENLLDREIKNHAENTNTLPGTHPRA